MTRLLPLFASLFLAGCGSVELKEFAAASASDDDDDGYRAADDCDDENASIHGGAPELCDGVDDDCDGGVDEDAVDAPTWYPDHDGDQHGDPTAPISTCSPPGGFVTEGSDCDDQEPLAWRGATELCDGVDNDCDGTVDGAAADAPTWYADADADGYGDPASATVACTTPTGFVANADDCDDGEPLASGDAAELCDGIDNDCDGAVDAGDVDGPTWYADVDGDGYGDPASSVVACTPPAGFVADGTDCDDLDPLAWPGASEECDGVDDDCDGTADEDAVDAPSWYRDRDGDGHGTPDRSAVSCYVPPGCVADASDCDDTQPLAWAGAAEVCDGADNDCDGVSDGSDSVDAATWYADRDGDGRGNPAESVVACSAPPGFLADAGDCDDEEPLAWSGAAEVCDGVDDDCDGVTDGSDSADASTWYADRDGDGHGNPDDSVVACSAPPGFVADATECDDTQPLAWAGAKEVCDGVDDDCDGVSDGTDAEDAPTWYADLDEDGFGDPDATVVACAAPPGSVADATDCDDTNAAQPDALGRCARPYTTSFGSYMLVINPGTFTMGGGDGDPEDLYLDHEVTLTHSFWLAEHEVTQDEWAAWAGAADPHPSRFDGYGDRPVERLTWEDVAVYANALSAAEGLTECYLADGSRLAPTYATDPYDCEGYRLPTEAEWEYAAIAGEDTSFSGANTYDVVGWYLPNAVASTHDVCTLQVNAWGLCDMSGNLWEWTNDYYGVSGGYETGAAETDPVGILGGTTRVTRGGSWGSDEREGRNGCRGFHAQADADSTLGFRLARSSL